MSNRVILYSHADTVGPSVRKSNKRFIHSFIHSFIIANKDKVKIKLLIKMKLTVTFQVTPLTKGIGERYSQTISNKRLAAPLRLWELPL
jgi:hypothetical protein